MIVEFVYLGFIAWDLQLVDNDSYIYLSNARFLAGESEVVYSGSHAPVTTLSNLPFALLDRVFPGSGFLGAKFLALAYTVGFVVVTYLLLRQFLTKTQSILALFFLSMNIVVIHYSVIPFADVPSAFFLTLTLYAYIKFRNNLTFLKAAVVSALIITTILSKYPAILVIPTIVLIELFNRNTAMLRNPKFWAMLIFPLLAFYLIQSVGYTLYYGLNPNSFIGVYKSLYYSVFGLTTKSGFAGYFPEVKLGDSFNDPFYEYIIAFALTASIPLLILFFVGLIVALKNRTKANKFFLAWTIGVLVPMSFIHKEFRYIVTYFPAFYYFAITGLFFVNANILSRFSWRKASSSLLIAIVLAFSVVMGFNELLSYKDPAYTNTIAKDSGEYIASITGPENNVYHVGESYVLHPKNFRFSEVNWHMYLYEQEAIKANYFSKRTVSYYEQPRNTTLFGENPVLVDALRGTSSRQVGQEAYYETSPLKDNDTLIFGWDKKYFFLKDVPEKLDRPLQVAKIRIRELNKISQDDCAVYRGAQEVTVCLENRTLVFDREVEEWYAGSLWSGEREVDAFPENITIIYYTHRKNFYFY